MVDLGERLRTLRVERGMTQSRLAQQLGVTKSVVSAYETGIRSPSYEVLLSLARIFSVSTDYLLGRETGRTVDVTGLSETELEVVANLIRVLKER